MFDIANRGPDYVLRWPRELFVLEAKAILAAAAARQWAVQTDEVSLLLTEAFVADTPERDFDRISSARAWGAEPVLKHTEDSWRSDPQRIFLNELIEIAPEFEEQHAPRPYYSQRIAWRQSASLVVEPDLDRARREWRDAVLDLSARGYLEKVAPAGCVDDDHIIGAEVILDALLEKRLGMAQLWSSFDAADWDEPAFFDLIEVFHDLVTRPRKRHSHDFGNCGWHYSVFVPRPAQVLYRWTVNQILARCGVDLRLADSGKELGRLTHKFDEARGDLLTSALDTPDPQHKSAMEHAISLFRARSAGVEEKRSACVVLAGLLEERRTLVKVELLSADERDLFVVANRFGIRHRGADQRTNYDPAYLDWIFWWYISTFELTDKLLAAQADDSPTPSAQNPLPAMTEHG